MDGANAFDRLPRFLQIGFGAFVICVFGFVLGMAVDVFQWRGGRYLALGIVGLGVIIGITATVAGLLSMALRAFRRRD